jgi:lambda family phage portal protein
VKNDDTLRLNLLDDLVGFFSPEAGYRRMQFRRASQQVRKYEAASTGRRTNGWKSPGSGSANAEIGPALVRVRERVRDLVRNNPNAGRAVGLLETYIAGTGIMSSINHPTPKNQAQLRALWKAWSESTDCDVDGLHTFGGLQALAARMTAEAGEALVIRRWRKASDGYRIPVPFQIQVLEGDYIDTLKQGDLSGGNYVVQGVEFNKRNQRVAYWLFESHPGEANSFRFKSLESKRVDARDVAHLYRVDRAGQVRGISWGAPCVIRHQDLDAFEDAQLLRQRIAACFAGFIRDMEVPIESASSEKEKSDLPEKIEAGMLEILPPGKTIEFPNLPTVTNDGHAERVLRSLAVGWGVTYEGITGDYSRVNYSSYRGAMIDLKRNVGKWQWHMFIPRFCEPTFRWFLEATDIAQGDGRGCELALDAAQVRDARPVEGDPGHHHWDPRRPAVAPGRDSRAGLRLRGASRSR